MPNSPPPERQRLIDAGQHAAIGVGLAVTDLFVKGLGVAAAIWAISSFTPLVPTDATDRDAAHRSGLRLRTDHGTGCQYLETRSGAIVPRFDRAGRQVCR